MKNEYSIITHGFQEVFYTVLISPSPENAGGGGGALSYANIVSLKPLYEKYSYRKRLIKEKSPMDVN